MDLMSCVCNFHKFYKKHLKGFTQVDWPVNLTYTFLWFKSTVKIWGKFYVQFLQKPSPNFQIFHYMETGIQYIEVKQNVEPAFLKNHTRKFSEILHSGFN